MADSETQDEKPKDTTPPAPQSEEHADTANDDLSNQTATTPNEKPSGIDATAEFKKVWDAINEVKAMFDTMGIDKGAMVAPVEESQESNIDPTTLTADDFDFDSVVKNRK